MSICFFSCILFSFAIICPSICSLQSLSPRCDEELNSTEIIRAHFCLHLVEERVELFFCDDPLFKQERKNFLGTELIVKTHAIMWFCPCRVIKPKRDALNVVIARFAQYRCQHRGNAKVPAIG